MLHAEGAQEKEIPEFAVLNASMKLSTRLAMSAHKSNADLELLGFGLFIEFEHLTGGKTIWGNGFFHENVQTLFNRLRKVNPTKCTWRGKDGNVTRFKGVHRVFVAVKTYMPLSLIHI